MQSVSLDVEEECPSINFVCPPSRIGLKNKIGENKDTGNAITFNFAFFEYVVKFDWSYRTGLR